MGTESSQAGFASGRRTGVRAGYPKGNRPAALAMLAWMAKGLGLAFAPSARAQSQLGCGEPKETDFVKTTVMTGLNEPLEMEFAPDGRIYLIEKVTGKLFIRNPATNSTVTAATFDVSIAGNHADGLLGLELDPAFASNHWLYLYYSPVSKVVNRLSRFTMAGDVLDLASEKILFEIPTQRNHCCHSAGGLEFGPNGNLFLSVGDNSKVTSGVLNTEAEGTASNTNDLRGKILRIHPEANGTYTVPEGNLFPPGTAKTRPEIYTMGHRNPFRFSVDPATGWVMAGEVGPDAQTDFDELNIIKSPGNMGWPYFVANLAYPVNGTPLPMDAPVNKSALNTGLQNLPAARLPAFWYKYSGSDLFPNFNKGGRVACGGPVYHYLGSSPSKIKFPPWFDGKWLIYDWAQRWIRAVTLDGQGKFLAVKDLFPAMMAKDEVSRISSMKVGPDGALYVLQYGWQAYTASTTGALFRIEYNPPAADCLPTSIAVSNPGPRSRDPHALPAYGREGRRLDAQGRTVAVGNSPSLRTWTPAASAAANP